MNQDKIANTIKEIRKNNNFTQRDLANELGVTYQAVSKWENGKNIPDIEILKLICNKYKIDINELLDNKIENKKNKLLIIIPIILISIIAIASLILLTKDNNYFKKTTSTNSKFIVDGSIANINNKTYINITSITSNIIDEKKYETIKATLYENYNDTNTKIAESENGKDITLNDYLKIVKFNIDDYKTNCKNEPKLYIEIQATNNGIITAYKIDLNLDEVCETK